MNSDGVAPSIFIIGAQCTGKTTLVKAISDHIRNAYPELPFTVIKELARGVLISTNVNRDDISSGSEQGMKFQKLVLQAQLKEELACQPHGLIISDRSGIDPIAYARKYGQPRWQREMLATPAWVRLRERMQQAIVVLCEPVPAWLSDDGVRLMPKDNTEWTELHGIFVNLLQESDITFYSLSATLTHIEQRVDFVLDIWRKKQGAHSTGRASGTM